jgi:hypothetical protein
VVRSAGILDFVSLALIAVGGGLMSYAAFFAEPVNRWLAGLGMGMLFPVWACRWCSTSTG